MSEDETPRAKSPHAFMREALGVQSRLLEQRQAFVAAALRGAQEAIDTGLGYQEHEVDRFFEAWAAQERPQRPQLRAMARVIYSAAAFADLERIHAALRVDDPTLADNSLKRIRDAIGELAERPFLGRPAEADLRERAVSRGPTGYAVLYRVLELDDVVLIAAIRHRHQAGYPSPA